MQNKNHVRQAHSSRINIMGLGPRCGNPLIPVCRKDGDLGIALSAILPGIGHVYAGSFGMGIILIASSIVLVGLSMSSFLTAPSSALSIYLVIWIASIGSAKRCVDRYNLSETEKPSLK